MSFQIGWSSVATIPSVFSRVFSTPTYPSLQPAKIMWVKVLPAHKNASGHLKVFPLDVQKVSILGRHRSNAGFHEGEDNSFHSTSCHFIT